ncbi:hypothetical protein BD311DRAFT_815902 [Dichomitus squalens]|uniref:Uncharacterized protein n=1 Tax=Dichomitus squalens TaxID=114155 RepID=A0A4Q9MDP0_9APHY|nr:hypothetical protein BD311DRAFT_815902 [Dichomitus squalens]
MSTANHPTEILCIIFHVVRRDALDRDEADMSWARLGGEGEGAQDRDGQDAADGLAGRCTHRNVYYTNLAMSGKPHTRPTPAAPTRRIKSAPSATRAVTGTAIRNTAPIEDNSYTARVPPTKRKRLPGGSSVNVGEPKKPKRPSLSDDFLHRLCSVMPDAPCPWPMCPKKFQLVQTGEGEGAARSKCKITEHFREHVEDGRIFKTNGAIVCPACHKKDQGNTFVRHVKAAHWHARWGCLLTLHGLECSWQGTRPGDVSQHVERKHRGHIDLLPSLPT